MYSPVSFRLSPVSHLLSPVICLLYLAHVSCPLLDRLSFVPSPTFVHSSSSARRPWLLSIHSASGPRHRAVPWCPAWPVQWDPCSLPAWQWQAAIRPALRIGSGTPPPCRHGSGMAVAVPRSCRRSVSAFHQRSCCALQPVKHRTVCDYRSSAYNGATDTCHARVHSLFYTTFTGRWAIESVPSAPCTMSVHSWTRGAPRR